jgi:hypothetical protein
MTKEGGDDPGWAEVLKQPQKGGEVKLIIIQNTMRSFSGQPRGQLERRNV